MIRIFFIILCTFCFLGLKSQKLKNTFSDQKINCEFETENGRLNGIYISKYKNGTKRSEGNFTDNVRSGIWTVYDSTGRKIHQREYINHLSFKRIFPEKEKSGAASLFDTTFYNLNKNSSGYIDYFTLSERMVILTSRIWRELKPENNKVLFGKQGLYSVLFPFITDSLNETYCSISENFETKMSINDIQKYSVKNYSIIAWKIKEDFIYDIERNVSEYRIIGICPVGINTKTKDTSDLYWMYFPMLRKQLAKSNVFDKAYAGKKTMDDLFFFRQFSGEIYKQSNVNDYALTDYCKTKEKLISEQQRIEIHLIESEHEIWLGNLPD